MAVPSLPQKLQLRRQALEWRKEHARTLTPELRTELETKLAEVVLPHIVTSRIIAGYHPLIAEISPYGILDRLTEDQIGLLPWFADRDSRMIWRRMPAEEVSPWGVLQPPGTAEALAPDTVLVPLVYGDRLGSRIGHGKGHYDRALSHLRESGTVRTIGIAWEQQISDEPIPADPWDIPLDAIATPREWIDCRQNRAGAEPSVSASSSS